MYVDAAAVKPEACAKWKHPCLCQHRCVSELKRPSFRNHPHLRSALWAAHCFRSLADMHFPSICCFLLGLLSRVNEHVRVPARVHFHAVVGGWCALEVTMHDFGVVSSPPPGRILAAHSAMCCAFPTEAQWTVDCRGWVGHPLLAGHLAHTHYADESSCFSHVNKPPFNRQ